MDKSPLIPSGSRRPFHAVWETLRYTRAEGGEGGRGRLLNIILWGMFLVLGTDLGFNIAASLLFSAQNGPLRPVSDTVLLALLGAIYWLNRRGKVNLSAGIFLILGTVGTSILYGLHPQEYGLLAYAISITLAGFLLDPKFSFVVACLSVAGYIVADYANGRAPALSFPSIAFLLILGLLSATAPGQAGNVRLARRTSLEKETGTPPGHFSPGQNNREMLAESSSRAGRHDEEALETREERCRLITEYVQDIVWQLDLNQCFTFVSPAVKRILGYAPEELQGSRITDLLDQKGFLHSQEILQNLERSPTGCHNPNEYKIRHKDGHWVDVEVLSSAVYNRNGQPVAFVGISRDITLRKQMESILRKSVDSLEKAERISHVGHYEIDLQTGKINWSPEVFRIFGLGLACPEPTIAEYRQLIDPADRGRVFESFEKSIHESGTFDMAYRIRKSNGEVRYVHSQAETAKNEQGLVTKFFGTLADITERSLAEDQIRQLNSELQQRVEERTSQLHDAQEQLIKQEKLALLGQMAGGVGHELRNPLGVINNIDYLLHLVLANADEKTRKYIDLIQRETRRADKIINDLLEFSRNQSVNQEPVAAQALIQEILRHYPPEEGTEVSIMFPAGLPLLYADACQITQVLGNLVVNAYQAMPAGGKLTLSARLEAGKVGISIQDTGSGILPENMQKLFEPLFTTKLKGIGLGLVVSKKLVEANGGKIEVQSKPGTGSNFTVWLPAWDGCNG